MWTRPLWLTLALLITTALSTTAFGAGEDAAMDFSWGGFVSQGLVYTDDHNFAGNSDDGVSTDYREAAVYSMWRISPEVRIGGQIAARKLGNMTEDKPQLDYLSLDVNLLDNASDTMGVRLGKLKLIHGFYNTSREVPFSRTSILLPQSMYNDETRDIQISAWGGELYGNVFLDPMRLEYTLTVGNLRHDEVAELLFFNRELSGHFDSAYLALGNLWFYGEADQWRVGLSYGNYRPTYRSGPLGEFGIESGRIDVSVSALSAEYNIGRLMLTAEYFRHNVDLSDLGGVYSLIGKTEFEAYYAQATYHMTDTLSAFVRYDVAYRDVDDKSGRKAAAIFGTPDYNMWSKDATLGIGWKFSQNWLARAEWHHIQGAARVPVADNDPSDANPNWNMVLFQLAYRF
jgi:hypothetical protein